MKGVGLGLILIAALTSEVAAQGQVVTFEGRCIPMKTGAGVMVVNPHTRSRTYLAPPRSDLERRRIKALSSLFHCWVKIEGTNLQKVVRPRRRYLRLRRILDPSPRVFVTTIRREGGRLILTDPRSGQGAQAPREPGLNDASMDSPRCAGWALANQVADGQRAGVRALPIRMAPDGPVYRYRVLAVAATVKRDTNAVYDVQSRPVGLELSDSEVEEVKLFIARAAWIGLKPRKAFLLERGRRVWIQGSASRDSESGRWLARVSLDGETGWATIRLLECSLPPIVSRSTTGLIDRVQRTR